MKSGASCVSVGWKCRFFLSSWNNSANLALVWPNCVLVENNRWALSSSISLPQLYFQLPFCFVCILLLNPSFSLLFTSPLCYVLSSFLLLISCPPFPLCCFLPPAYLSASIYLSEPLILYFPLSSCFLKFFFSFSSLFSSFPLVTAFTLLACALPFHHSRTLFCPLKFSFLLPSLATYSMEAKLCVFIISEFQDHNILINMLTLLPFTQPAPNDTEVMASVVYAVFGNLSLPWEWFTFTFYLA